MTVTEEDRQTILILSVISTDILTFVLTSHDSSSVSMWFDNIKMYLKVCICIKQKNREICSCSKKCCQFIAIYSYLIGMYIRNIVYAFHYTSIPYKLTTT